MDVRDLHTASKSNLKRIHLVKRHRAVAKLSHELAMQVAPGFAQMAQKRILLHADSSVQTLQGLQTIGLRHCNHGFDNRVLGVLKLFGLHLLGLSCEWKLERDRNLVCQTNKPVAISSNVSTEERRNLMP